MSINLTMPVRETELKPRITVIGVGGAGGNAINNMIRSGLMGVEFVATNTDAQSLAQSEAERKIQLGASITQGLGAGSRPDIGRAAAEEAIDEILEHLSGTHMAFITAGMGGGTGTGAAPVIARAARELGILTVGVTTKPFNFEGVNRMRTAEAGIEELQQYVDTLIIIPNQNLFRVANEKTTFADAFKMADDVLHCGVRGVTDLMVKPGLINLDFADIRSVMTEMGKAQMGTGESEGEKRALDAAEAAISNPLLEDASMKGAFGVLINITGGPDMTMFEVDEAANRIKDEVDEAANIIFGTSIEEGMEGRMRVSVVATGIDTESAVNPRPQNVSLLTDHMKSPEPIPEKPARADTFPPLEAILQPATPGDAAKTSSPPPAASFDSLSFLSDDRKGESRKTAAETPAAPSAKANAAAGEEAETARPMSARERFARIAPPFIAPRPAKPASPEAASSEADPFAAAAMTNAGARAEKPRGGRINMFKRVTGITLGKEKAPAAPAPAADPGKLRDSGTPPAQPNLGGFDNNDRPLNPQSDDDLLEIPAFLRRQAN